MSDKASEIANYNELKFSRQQGFFDKSLGIRFLIGSLFVLCFFAFLHFREVRVEVLELGSIAPSYMVTQIDFDFYDEEATIILKQDAVKDVGAVYSLPEKNVRQSRIEFENFLIYNQDWRKYSDNSTFEEVYKGIDAIEKVLLQVRFTDPRTLQKMKDSGLSTQFYIPYTPENKEGQLLPKQVWDEIKEKAFPPDFISAAAADFIIGYYQKMAWSAHEDIPAQRFIRRKIQASVPDKITHVSAGNRIINQGEKVTARHISMQQAMKRVLGENRNLDNPLTLLGSLIFTLILSIILFAYFKVNNPSILQSNRKLFLIVTICLLTLGLSKLTEFFFINSKMNLVEIVRYPLFVPFAAILLCSLMNPAIATFISAFLTFVFTLTLAFNPKSFLVMNLTTALVAILSMRTLRKRKEIFVVCGKAWLSAIGLIIGIYLYHNATWSSSMLVDMLTTGLFLLLTAILVAGILPLFESLFRVMTDVTLMEYMDPNNDLLRRLTIEAPGTYQHSVVVGNLAESAASAIGANGLFCRVATLYHDVGKLTNPQYFTENQHGDMNLHQLLTPQESAQVILAHVSEGVAMGRKAGLPEQFIDIIKEHHGTTLVYYFYRKALEQAGSDKSLVNESEFRYFGPKPRSKESAIIMLADTVEAASRSLDKITEESLMELATRLIRDKADDGQFDDCLLTFEELAIVKETLVNTLVAFGHSRIKYPKRENEKKGPPSVFEVTAS